jgi:hypothetical protein
MSNHWPQPRALHEMIGLGFGDAVNINAGLGHSIAGY